MKQLSESIRKKVSKNQLTQQIYDVLFDLIVKNELKPGERLNIEGVSKQLSVSRSPVSAAFSALERDGFLIVLPQNGTFVRDLTYTELDAIYVTRAALERVVAAFAIKEVDVKDLATYKTRFESYMSTKELTETNITLLFELEAKLHDFLAGFLPDIVRREYDNICNLTRRSRLLNLKHELASSDITEMIKNNVDIHIEIIDAFIAKKLDYCIELLERDVLYTRDGVLSYLY